MENIRIQNTEPFFRWRAKRPTGKVSPAFTDLVVDLTPPLPPFPPIFPFPGFLLLPTSDILKDHEIQNELTKKVNGKYGCMIYQSVDYFTFNLLSIIFP